MPLEEERKEYVLETSGMIFKGTFKNLIEFPWDFGQVSFYVMTAGNLACAKCSIYQVQQ